MNAKTLMILIMILSPIVAVGWTVVVDYVETMKDNKKENKRK